MSKVHHCPTVELRLKELNQEIEVLRGEIEEERRDKKELVQEYELKKVNFGNRKRKLKQIEQQIRDYRRKIEEAFNPQAYREHQKKVFEVQMKNEMLSKNIDSVRRRVKTLEVQTEQC